MRRLAQVFFAHVPDGGGGEWGGRDAPQQSLDDGNSLEGGETRDPSVTPQQQELGSPSPPCPHGPGMGAADSSPGADTRTIGPATERVERPQSVARRDPSYGTRAR